MRRESTDIKVSIITPSYNRGDLIENTIESVLNQTHGNIEYIVVDGMSTDNTMDILESYKKRGKLRYVSRKDEGMYHAINDGIKMASGDIIAYLNSDDLYFPWTVQRAVEAFQENSSVDMIYGDSMVVDFVNEKKYLNIYAQHKRYWLHTGKFLCQPTVFLRKNIFNEVGYFNTEYNYLADCEFWLRINSKSNLKITKIDEIMAIECNHAGTFRERYGAEIIKEKNIMMNKYVEGNSNKDYFSILLNVISSIMKELKIWEFVITKYSRNVTQCVSWNYYLRDYDVRFNVLNYFLCKLTSNRTKFPRFDISKRTSQ